MIKRSAGSQLSELRPLTKLPDAADLYFLPRPHSININQPTTLRPTATSRLASLVADGPEPIMNATDVFSSVNSTVAPASYFDHYDYISKNAAHLNTFEVAWASWYAFMQNDVLATGIMSFLMHEIVYFGRSE